MTHNFHSSILRAYDIRGIVGDTVTEQDAYYVGRAFATRLVREKGSHAVVGRDGRLSSPVLMEQVIKGLRAGGIDVTAVGLGPTPMVYFAMKHLNADGALMVTGSHNPSHYNGFKVTLNSGPLFDDDIQEFGALVASNQLSSGDGQLQELDIQQVYLEYLLNDFRVHYPTARPLKIAWDAGNGSAGEVVEKLTAQLPGEHILLNTTIDGNFPAHHPDPVVPENLVQLQEAVRLHNCDFGIAFDGDGDRIGVIDAQARIVWGDLLVAFYAQEVLKQHPGAYVIADVKASQVFFDEVKRMGGEPVMWRTGHSIIKAKMKEINCPLAGEMSGHMFFADRYFGFDDAPYAALRLIGKLSTQTQTLGQWLDRLPKRYTTPELRIECDDERKFEVIKEITAKLRQQQVKLEDIDGVRVTTEQGWWLLRASNTQSALVARVEANTEAEAQQLQRELAVQLEPYGLKVA